MNTTLFDEETINRIANSEIAHEDYYHTTCDLCDVIQTIIGEIYDRVETMQNRSENPILCMELVRIAAQVDAVARVIKDRTRNDEIFEMIRVFFNYKQSKKQQS